MLTCLRGRLGCMSPPHPELIYLLHKDLSGTQHANYRDAERSTRLTPTTRVVL